MNSPTIPVRPITRPPGFHWFGYYDKLQFDPTGRFVLGMEAGFEHRPPTTDDWVRVGMVDLEDGDEWMELGTSNAWCWQQGCMLQWRPGSDGEVVWNDRWDDGQLVCHIVDAHTGNRRTLPRAVYTISPDGRTGLGIDFLRTGRLRPGYGYAGEDASAADLAPADSGIWRIDLETGKSELIVTIAEVAAMAHAHCETAGRQHYFNHVLWSPGGERFIFLHRCRAADGSDAGGFMTRMFTADASGGELRIIDDYGGMSHFIWRDDRHILGWANRPSHGWAFYLFDEREPASPEPVGLGTITADGHCTYLPGGEWIVNDAYPQLDAGRLQRVYLYRPADGRLVEVGGFPAGAEYAGEWRCDLHPRHSRDGRQVCFDSPHGGDGRQMYLADLAGLSDATGQ